MASISYIITTYNRSQDLLLRAMQSIIMERLEGPDELILVDDCSVEPATIPTAIVAAFGGQVRLIRNTKNKGFNKSRNVGLMAAQYEYILFLDDDDIAYPNRSRDLLTSIEGTSHAFVAGRTRLLDNGGQYRLIPIQFDFPLTLLQYLCNMAHINGFIWRRTALLDVGGLDTRSHYFGDQITPLLLILRGESALQIGLVVSQFQFIPGGITQETKRNKLMQQYIVELFTVLLNEQLPNDFRQLCNEVLLFLQRQTNITLDEFLDYLNHQYNSTTSSLTAL